MMHIKEYDLFVEEKEEGKGREDCIEKILAKKINNLDPKAVRAAKMKERKVGQPLFRKEELQTIIDEMNKAPTQLNLFFSQTSPIQP